MVQLLLKFNIDSIDELSLGGNNYHYAFLLFCSSLILVYYPYHYPYTNQKTLDDPINHLYATCSSIDEVLGLGLSHSSSTPTPSYYPFTAVQSPVTSSVNWDFMAVLKPSSHCMYKVWPHLHPPHGHGFIIPNSCLCCTHHSCYDACPLVCTSCCDLHAHLSSGVLAFHGTPTCISHHSPVYSLDCTPHPLMHAAHYSPNTHFAGTCHKTSFFLFYFHELDLLLCYQPPKACSVQIVDVYLVRP